MNEQLKTLLNLRSLRAYSRDLSLEQLEEAFEKLMTVVDERQNAEAEAQAEKAEQQAKLAAITSQISKDGIDIQALLNTLSGETKKKVKRAPKPAKYKYVDSSGTERTWTGQGRVPTAIQTQLDSEKSLDDFLIK
ncbi:H-NS histone family protein [Vibrio profundum]|uniref:H-NS family histone-like protein n=1 Tax=Vibrio profundum TaxID=2910247 RepID=UPI003D130E9A